MAARLAPRMQAEAPQATSAPVRKPVLAPSPPCPRCPSSPFLADPPLGAADGGDEHLQLLYVLHAGAKLHSAGDVHGIGPDVLDRPSDIGGVEPAGEDHPAVAARRTGH